MHTGSGVFIVEYLSYFNRLCPHKQNATGLIRKRGREEGGQRERERERER